MKSLRRVLACGIGMALLLVAGGCSRGLDSSGSLRVESLGPSPVVLRGEFVAGVYSHGLTPETSFFLTDVPIESLIDQSVTQGQIVHVEMLWPPKPGKTPLDKAATNASVRYVIIVDGEVGVYGGAGFIMPSGKAGKSRLTVSVREATLTLLESTPGFVDRLGQAQLTGKFSAEYDDLRARQIRFAVSQKVTNALGKSTLVRGKEKTHPSYRVGFGVRLD